MPTDPTPPPADRAALITMSEQRLADIGSHTTSSFIAGLMREQAAELDAQRRALFHAREDRRRLEAWSAKWALEWAEVLGGDSLAELRTIVNRADVRKEQG